MGLLSKIFGKDVAPWRDSGGRGWDFLGTFKQWAASDKIWKNLSTAELEGIYAKMSLIFACIRELATCVSEAPLVVTHIDPEDPERIEPERNHWATPLLARPNPFYTRNMFLYYEVSRLMLTGKSHVWKLRNSYRRVTELWPVPTGWVTVVPGEGNQLIKGFTIKQRYGKNLPIPYEDMMYQWLPDPTSTWDGAGPMQAASYDYQLDVGRSNYLAEMLENLKVPGMTIKTGVPLTPEQKADLRAALHDQVGKGHRGEPFVISGEGADVIYNNPLADLDMPGLAMMSESRLCSAFGIPPIIVGARVGLEHATYSNYGEARSSLYRETMRPLWGSLGASYTQNLLVSEGDTDYRVAFDTRAIPELQEDQNKAAERAKTLLTGSVATRNEARHVAGLPPDEGPRGTVYLMPTTMIEVYPDDLEGLGDEGGQAEEGLGESAGDEGSTAGEGGGDGEA